jgi:hypothetical protein
LNKSEDLERRRPCRAACNNRMPVFASDSKRTLFSCKPKNWTTCWISKKQTFRTGTGRDQLLEVVTLDQVAQVHSTTEEETSAEDHPMTNQWWILEDQDLLLGVLEDLEVPGEWTTLMMVPGVHLEATLEAQVAQECSTTDPVVQEVPVGVQVVVHADGTTTKMKVRSNVDDSKKLKEEQLSHFT